MNLDTESTTHTHGMEGESRSSHKQLLLQVWCGLLTVAIVIMGVLLVSIKSKSAEDGVPTLKPDTVSPSDKLSSDKPFSYIQLKYPLDKTTANGIWQEDPESVPRSHSHSHSHFHSHFRSLSLRNDTIYCNEKGVYLIYAQVTFAPPTYPNKNWDKSVILKKNARFGKKERILVVGTLSKDSKSGSIWVAKIVSLMVNDSISLDITDGNYLYDKTFWGAYQLH